MILTTTTVEDFARFEQTFSTKGLNKRRAHGSKGATVFHDPREDDRVWVVFDFTPAAWNDFLADPEVRAIMQEAGLKTQPETAEHAGTYDA